VTLQVSSGKAPTMVIPALEGKEASAARTILEDMGFVVHVAERQVSDPKLDGLVLATIPKAGTKVARGSIVTMNVGVKT
jgi:beta-lactam-binding protein with PASTA domain